MSVTKLEKLLAIKRRSELMEKKKLPMDTVIVEVATYSAPVCILRTDYSVLGR